MLITDSEKVISVLEQLKSFLPGKNGKILPKKYLTRECMDELIQRIRAASVEIDISEEKLTRTKKLEKVKEHYDQN